jgi:hypothetical protein
VILTELLLSGKRLARNVVSMAAGEPAAPLADNAELTEFISALKQEVRTWPIYLRTSSWIGCGTSD